MSYFLIKCVYKVNKKMLFCVTMLILQYCTYRYPKFALRNNNFFLFKFFLDFYKIIKKIFKQIIKQANCNMFGQKTTFYTNVLIK